MPLRSLRARLLVANLIVGCAVLGTVVVAVSLVSPTYFAQAMGHGPGDPMGAAMGAATRAAFDEAMRNALLAAGVIAVVTSIVVSLAVSGAIAEPVGRLAAAARRISQGHYSERVPVTRPDELGELAASFNAMGASLEATETRRVQLVGDVAHELRTPLATLDGYLEGLQDGVVKPGDETWRLLRRETWRLTRLVDDLQELWRAETQQLPLKTESLDASTVAREVAERFAPQAASRGTPIEVEAPGRLAIRADRGRLIQILGNYVSNALRYAPEGEPVRLRVGAVPGFVEFAVIDRGPGLTPEQCEQVFERFYRADPSRSRAAGGSGIGLAIARALAVSMGGHVRAQSEGPGAGSTFLLDLPSGPTP